MLPAALFAALLSGAALVNANPVAASPVAASPVTCASATADGPRPELALMGTVPVYWGETGDFSEALDGGGEPHWARSVLERCYRLQPVDYLSAEALAGYSRLLLAQPRGFSPEENVALDAWVRAGGRLLLFADPWMTGESRFAIGDRRRPQDVVLLSPILARWGLELQFDPQQEEPRATREIAGTAVPVALAGEFALTGAYGDCRLAGSGLAAECHLEEGFALIVADAALLDLYHAPAGAAAALSALAAQSFASFGDDAGRAAPVADNADKTTQVQIDELYAQDGESGAGPPE